MEKKMLPSTLVRDWTLIRTASRRVVGPKRNSSHSALVKTPERYIGTMTKKLSTVHPTAMPSHHCASCDSPSLYDPPTMPT